MSSTPEVQELTAYACPACGYVGISGVSGGVGPWPGDGKVRCPSSRCEYRTVMVEHGALVELSVAEALADALGEITSVAVDQSLSEGFAFLKIVEIAGRARAEYRQLRPAGEHREEGQT